jgi:glycosyltransferase involved in cell wall biosynthesis
LSRYLIDAVELGQNPKGIARVLASLTPRVVERSPDEVFVACTNRGAAEAAGVPGDRLVLVPRTLQSRWEQWGLPRVARELRATAIYSHRESGAMWGPPLVLHIPEDPEVRWARTPPSSLRERMRRRYSRTTMRRALRRAVVAASTPALATQISRRYGLAPASISIIPLGVDLALFSPAEQPARNEVFHLGSSDPRDRTVMVVEAWARARKTAASLPPLVIGGALGELTADVRRAAATLEVDVRLTGRLDDSELAEHLRQAAVVVQPSSDEGFGLQPLEAMASGAPVVVTAADAVLDVVGEAAVVCDETVAGLADGIIKATREEDRLRPAGRERAQAFTWDTSAEAVVQALETANRR